MPEIHYQVFISRSLKPDSPLRAFFESEKIPFTDQSLLVFEQVPVPALPEVEWLFFYSSRGVEFLDQQFPISSLSAYRLAAMGPGTAQTLRQLGGTPALIGDGQPVKVATDLLKASMGARVAFIQARQSRQSVQKLVQHALETHSLIAYENRKRVDFDLPICSHLIFTSPMNVEAYFTQYAYVPGQKVFAIGSTTADALNKQGIFDVQFPTEPSEAALLPLLHATLGD